MSIENVGSRPGQIPVSPSLLEVKGISKRFGGVQALNAVSLTVDSGTVHALVGANGAGKSTLGKVIAGVHVPTAGEVFVDGKPARFRSPADALKLGIAIMQQEISLADDLTVLENTFLGTEDRRPFALSRRQERQKFDDLLERTGFELSPTSVVSDLRIAQQQEVSILWALAREARLIVMDESTAALDRKEAAKLLRTVQQLRQTGISVVYVSHFLEEILEVSDCVTILANGQHVSTSAVEELDIPRMVVGMLGEPLEATFPPLAAAPASDEPIALSVKGLSQRQAFADIDFEVRRGEILGLYGLVGSGRSEIAHTLAGASGKYGGTVTINGISCDLSSPRSAMNSGITLLPESRKDQGLFLNLSQLWNTTISSLPRFSPGGVVSARRETLAAKGALSSMAVMPPQLSTIVGNLSGGNQQKVLFAKCALTNPDVLILDEPTRGVDIGAKRAIYDVIQEIASTGTAIVLISSEHEEITHLSHRLMVMRRGRIVATYRNGDVDGDGLVGAALGVERTGDPE